MPLSFSWQNTYIQLVLSAWSMPVSFHLTEAKIPDRGIYGQSSYMQLGGVHGTAYVWDTHVECFHLYFERLDSVGCYKAKWRKASFLMDRSHTEFGWYTYTDLKLKGSLELNPCMQDSLAWTASSLPLNYIYTTIKEILLHVLHGSTVLHDCFSHTPCHPLRGFKGVPFGLQKTPLFHHLLPHLLFCQPYYLLSWVSWLSTCIHGQPKIWYNSPQAM